MKKIITVLLSVFICALLASCGEKKEYTVAEVNEVLMGIIESVQNEMASMADEELYGTSSNDEDRQEHFNTLYEKLKKKYSTDYDIKNGTLVITGIFVEFYEHEDTNSIEMREATDEIGYKSIIASTNDSSFESLAEGETIRIAVDYKDGSLKNATLLDNNN